MIKLIGIPLILLAAIWAVGFAFHLFPLPGSKEFAWWVFPWAITAVLFIGGGIVIAGCILGSWLESKFPEWE